MLSTSANNKMTASEIIWTLLAGTDYEITPFHEEYNTLLTSLLLNLLTDTMTQDFEWGRAEAQRWWDGYDFIIMWDTELEISSTSMALWAFLWLPLQTQDTQIASGKWTRFFFLLVCLCLLAIQCYQSLSSVLTL